MVNFTYQPNQYYSRTPAVNQTQPTFYNPSQAVPTNNGIQNNIGSYTGYNLKNPAPGTVGYSLPAQSYANYGINHVSNYGTQSLKTGLINTAINAGVNGLINGLTGGASSDPTGGRLNGSGVAQGGTAESLLQPVSGQSATAFQDDSEDRVIIYDQSGKFIGTSEILAPLQDLGGVLFPYTPTIQVAHKASYDPMSLVHTNYITPQYQHSQIDSISIQGMFTANYPAEAEYVIAMMHFFRATTKMFYGQDQLAGTPPPVLYLDAYGPWTFDHIPVVITGFDYTFPNDVDYISCTVRTQKQKVPTTLTVNLTMLPTYSRNNISNNFGLDNFTQGKLTTGAMGQRTRTGGWL
jgi:hypothetical protein